MIPILEAEESIRLAQAIAVGTGSIKNPRAMLDEWERTAKSLEAPAAAAPGKPPALFSDEVLARLPVRRVPTTRKG
jgi:hypothetical protein